MGGAPLLRRAIALGSILALLTSAVARADAPTRDAAIAQSLFDDGRRLMGEKHYEEACPKFEESQRLDPSTGTLLNLAVCREQQGKIASAWEEFREASAAAKRAGETQRAAFAGTHAAALESRGSLITIQVPAEADVAGLVLELDGVALGRAVWGTAVPVDGGSHRIVAKADGKLPWESTIDVAPEHDTRSIVVPVLAQAPVAPSQEPAAPIAPSPATEPTLQHPTESGGTSGARIVGIATAGVGAAALVVGAVFGVLTGSAFNQQKSDCPSASSCPHHDLALQDHQRATTDATVSTIAFIAGGVLVTSGAIVYFVSPTASSSGAGLQVVGAF